MIHEAVNVTVHRDGKESQHKAILIVRDKTEMVEELDRYLNMLVSYKTDGVTGSFIEGVNMDGEEVHAVISSESVSAVEAADLVKNEKVTLLSTVG